MRISLGDVSLWFDVSGPSVIPQGDTTVERPVLVAIHGGPGLDHITVKSALAPLADDFQILYPDLRGHGRSDHSSAEFWNLRTWADDLRRLCDALGLNNPIVLGSSFGGFVALTYAALFPDHPGGVILANTTGGHRDQQRVIEAFSRVGGDEAAAAIQRSFTEDTEEADAEFKRVCYPLYSGKPGWAEESRLGRARTITSLDVSSHYYRHEFPTFDPWSMTGAVRCPVLLLAGGRPYLPTARGRGASQPTAGGNHPLGAPSWCAPHHLPRPPGPRFPSCKKLRLPAQGKSAGQLPPQPDMNRYGGFIWPGERPRRVRPCGRKRTCARTPGRTVP
jgi:pimeloyl-ACP methyl ester carboxylesterase